MADEPKVLTERAFKALCFEARSLGIDTEDYVNTQGSIDALRRDMATKANEKVAALQSEVTAVEEEQTVLVRIVEWMDWIPSEKSKVVGAPMPMSHGVTSFQSLKNERLLELGVSGTGRNYEWEEEEDCDVCEGTGRVDSKTVNEDLDEPGIDCDKCDGTGKLTTKYCHGLYAFQAILAQNTSPELARALQGAQAQPMLEELARDQAEGGSSRDKRDDLVVIQSPNRNDRRGGKARKKRR